MHICITWPQWINLPKTATRLWGFLNHCVNIGSGNGLLLDCTKPLPETILTYLQWGSEISIWGQFHNKYLYHQSLKLGAILKEFLRISILDMSLKIINWKLQLHLPGANEFINTFQAQYTKWYEFTDHSLSTALDTSFHEFNLNKYFTLCINNLVQDRGNSIANALELPHTCAKQSIWYSTNIILRACAYFFNG